MRKMAESPEFFFSTCSSLFERMVDTVPRDVELTEPIQPIHIKPRDLKISFSGNDTMNVSGLLRVCHCPYKI
jgi:hypothetical protein